MSAHPHNCIVTITKGDDFNVAFAKEFKKVALKKCLVILQPGQSGPASTNHKINTNFSFKIIFANDPNHTQKNIEEVIQEQVTAIKT